MSQILVKHTNDMLHQLVHLVLKQSTDSSRVTSLLDNAFVYKLHFLPDWPPVNPELHNTNLEDKAQSSGHFAFPWQETGCAVGVDMRELCRRWCKSPQPVVVVRCHRTDAAWRTARQPDNPTTRQPSSRWRHQVTFLTVNRHHEIGICKTGIRWG